MIRGKKLYKIKEINEIKEEEKVVFIPEPTAISSKKIKGRKLRISKKQPHLVDLKDVKPVIDVTVAGIPDIKSVKPVIDTGLAGEKKDDKIKIKTGSKMPATIFFIIVLLLGFYIIYDQFLKDKGDVILSDDDLIEEVGKIDESKDYIYYENEREISSSCSLNNYIYKDIKININNDNMKTLTDKLNRETSELYDANMQEDNETFKSRNYVFYESDTYLTLVVIDESLEDCEVVDREVTSYVIIKKTGFIQNDDELLNIFSTSEQELVKNAIINRTEEEYLVDDTNDIVNQIILNGVDLYVDNKECLGIYYKGILEDNDYGNIKIVCN